MERRVFLIVLDSLGIGGALDAAAWGDEGSNTFASIRRCEEFNCPTLTELGLCNIAGVGGGIAAPRASFARMREASAGKDTTVGHWEIAGLISESPLPTYPQGFPDEVIAAFSKAIGRGVLCNKPYSGTDVIRDYGEEHLATGCPIVYTSADSVFQVAAHEDVYTREQLYDICETARRLLVGKHGVGRVIARPFAGTHPFVRTSYRRDFSLLPPRMMLPTLLQKHHISTASVGKIYDIFAGQGFDRIYPSKRNDEGMAQTLSAAQRGEEQFYFVNLVDFDMVYGHRNDIVGYAAAMTAFDRDLARLLPLLRQEDVLIITADHGCDPATPSTDHSREDTPMLIYGADVRSGVDLGVRDTFADIGATVAELFGLKDTELCGTSFWPQVQKEIQA